MSGHRDPNGEPTLAEAAGEEIKGMAKGGLEHPSTKPVLTGMAVGAVAAALLPVVTWPVGLAVGGGFALWQRIKR